MPDGNCGYVNIKVHIPRIAITILCRESILSKEAVNAFVVRLIKGLLNQHQFSLFSSCLSLDSWHIIFFTIKCIMGKTQNGLLHHILYCKLFSEDCTLLCVILSVFSIAGADPVIYMVITMAYNDNPQADGKWTIIHQINESRSLNCILEEEVCSFPQFIRIQ